MPFRTDDGVTVPVVTAARMREVDRMAGDAFGLGILQMMENAGRNLPGNAMEMLSFGEGPVVILAGAGGNGGGGLAKIGLQHVPGELFLADIGIPAEVYACLGIAYHFHFAQRYWVRLVA